MALLSVSAGIVRCAKETEKLVTIEDHSIIGGIGSIVSDVLAELYPKKEEVISNSSDSMESLICELHSLIGLSNIQKKRINSMMMILI